jgi:hypothetical protein
MAEAVQKKFPPFFLKKTIANFSKREKLYIISGFFKRISWHISSDKQNLHYVCAGVDT